MGMKLLHYIFNAFQDVSEVNQELIVYNKLSYVFGLFLR
jgi:hypothetical protein